MFKNLRARLRLAGSAMLLCGTLAAAPLSHAVASGPFGLLTSNWASSDAAKTKYPIVLVHGLFGFDNILGVDYFFRIPQELAEAGAKVYVAQLSGTNSNEVRGEQLIRELKTIRALGGDPSMKFNLIGHSQGSPTSRYVAAVAPDLVASVTAVGGANHGSKLYDLLSKPPGGNIGAALLNSPARLMAQLIGALSGKNPATLPEIPGSAFYALSTEGSNAFNKKYPQGLPPAGSCASSGPAIVNGIRYYSWTGHLVTTNLLDPSDAPLLALSAISFPGGDTSDGLVSTCGSRLGAHLGDYPQNHMDEVNQVFGLTQDGLWGVFAKKPVQLYVEQGARLKNAGL